MSLQTLRWAENGAQGSEGRQLHPELQFARCMSNRYRSEQFPRCVSCTRRWAGDTCRFQGIRFFLKDDQRNIVGISFVENQRPDAPTMNFPLQWNVPLTEQHIRRTKVTSSLCCFFGSPRSSANSRTGTTTYPSSGA